MRSRTSRATQSLSPKGRILLIALVAGTLSALPSCRNRQKSRGGRQTERIDPTLTLVTGYCNCERCCGWKRSWFGFGTPVYVSGPLKGKPKYVGVTSSGTRARRGTIAADPKVYPFGTKLNIPGYGLGTVEDTGGSIRGRHIDIWFPTHEEAVKWGRKLLKLK